MESPFREVKHDGPVREWSRGRVSARARKVSVALEGAIVVDLLPWDGELWCGDGFVPMTGARARFG